MSELTKKIVPKTQRSKRALASRAPKLHENTKTSLLLRGLSTSALLVTVLRDLHKLKSPDSLLLSKRNPTRPFEDASSIEFLTTHNDTSLFVVANHSKKRPHNLILGRTFDGQMLDVVEFGIEEETFLSMQHFNSIRSVVVRYASKPTFVFQGAAFDLNPDFAVVKSLFLDFFRGETMEKINLNSLDHVIIVTATADGRILFRHYAVQLKKSSGGTGQNAAIGGRFPRIELDEVGPRMNFYFRRRKQASDAVVSASMKVPKGAKKGKQKNIETGPMGDRMGRVHMQRQNLQNLALANIKGLKRKKSGGGEEQKEGTGTAEGEEEGGESGGRKKKTRSGPGGFGPNAAPNQKAATQ